ncbi:MAG: hypothetical protein BGO87_01160 [Flavobacteriia bacterium 40-80]|nr:MAG: hypothetical protein BGO87_01160 [Flavobacteriia bacterium 40-80]
MKGNSKEMKKLLYIIVLFFCCAASSIAQQNYTMYAMTKMAQSHYENPSNYANGKIYIGIGLSHHSIGVNHSGFTLNRVFVPRSQDDTLVLDQDRLKKSLWGRNYIMTDVRNELLGIGFHVKKNYFSLSISNRIMGNIVYPKDLIILGLEGNGRSLLGERINLNGLGAHIDAYLEVALGYNRKINEKLRVGGRLKFLSGYGNFSTKKSKLGITTDKEDFDLTVDGKFKFASSGFRDFFDTTNSGGGYTFDPSMIYKFKNFGMALDLGATYNLTDKIELNASLLDFGFIRWKNETASYETDNLDFRFEGVNLKEYLNDSTEYLDRLQDSLLSKIDKDITYNPYTSTLSSRFYIGARYKVTDWFTVGVTSYNQIVGNRLRMAGIISGTIQLKNWLGFTANYSTYGRSWGNIGLGLSLRGGPIQFYVMTDNILAINYTGVKNAHVTFGLNLLIGKLDPKLKASKI